MFLVFYFIQDAGTGLNKRENPHKYLLYKPTFSQLFTFLASGFKELPPTGAMLLYLSADGCLGNTKHTEDGGFIQIKSVKLFESDQTECFIILMCKGCSIFSATALDAVAVIFPGARPFCRSVVVV